MRRYRCQSHKTAAETRTEAEYAAQDGYRQAATNQTAGDLSKGEKTLAGFKFEDSKFGGKLHLPFYDGDGYDLGKLKLAIK